MGRHRAKGLAADGHSVCIKRGGRPLLTYVLCLQCPRCQCLSNSFSPALLAAAGMRRDDNFRSPPHGRGRRCQEPGWARQWLCSGQHVQGFCLRLVILIRRSAAALDALAPAAVAGGVHNHWCKFRFQRRNAEAPSASAARAVSPAPSFWRPSFWRGASWRCLWRATRRRRRRRRRRWRRMMLPLSLMKGYYTHQDPCLWRATRRRRRRRRRRWRRMMLPLSLMKGYYTHQDPRGLLCHQCSVNHRSRHHCILSSSKWRSAMFARSLFRTVLGKIACTRRPPCEKSRIPSISRRVRGRELFALHQL